jgi:putative flippase GtrA
MDRKLRFLLVGAWNALFSYVSAVFVFMLLSPYLEVLVISILTNVLAITMSFSMNKFFVFCTKGSWLKEYMRSYIVYGSNIVLGIFGFWLLVGILHVSVWISQGVLVLIGVLLAYVGHNKITFKHERP